MKTNIAIFVAGIFTNILVYFKLPSKVPVHFNFSGRPDRWGNKAEFLIEFLIFLGVIFLLYVLVPRIDPKRKELWNSRSYHLIFGVLLLFFALFPLVPYLYIKGLSNLKLINILIGVLFVLLGNYLPGIKPNYFVGIRTPWTLENETVWKKTHRVGGWSFVLIGILIIFSVFLPASWSTTVLLILVCAVAFFLVLYSYILWWKISKEK